MRAVAVRVDRLVGAPVARVHVAAVRAGMLAVQVRLERDRLDARVAAVRARVRLAARVAHAVAPQRVVVAGRVQADVAPGTMQTCTLQIHVPISERTKGNTAYNNLYYISPYGHCLSLTSVCGAYFWSLQTEFWADHFAKCLQMFHLTYFLYYKVLAL